MSEAASAKASVARNKRGPKPELKLAMRDAFSQLLTTPDQFTLVANMTQKMRLEWVGKALSLPEDERPSRSYVEEVWRQWASDANTFNPGK